VCGPTERSPPQQAPPPSGLPNLATPAKSRNNQPQRFPHETMEAGLDACEPAHRAAVRGRHRATLQWHISTPAGTTVASWRRFSSSLPPRKSCVVPHCVWVRACVATIPWSMRRKRFPAMEPNVRPNRKEQDMKNQLVGGSLWPLRNGLAACLGAAPLSRRSSGVRDGRGCRVDPRRRRRPPDAGLHGVFRSLRCPIRHCSTPVGLVGTARRTALVE
jgi:hypothetical protein